MKQSNYYVPHSSIWPIFGAVSLFFVAAGLGLLIAFNSKLSIFLCMIGFVLLIIMFSGWFGIIINESAQGLYNSQVNNSFIQGMSWFIFSEIMFFAAFFGVLVYLRVFAIPWLGGEGNNEMTNVILWPDFTNHWPLSLMPDGTKTEIMKPWGLPLINTIILICSSITLYFSHYFLDKKKTTLSSFYLVLTILLGFSFIFLQFEEYMHAYIHMGLTLQSGVYGSVFFLLTGFHGLHVILGTIFLIVIWVRMINGAFLSENNFGYQAGVWYWHFVDIIWLCVFAFVYVF